ncbi:L-rhamnose mutarotase [Photobacterium damselae]|uniref:L-rhamnose mutarotase n=1 Tax=Photobacterium damselae TaxID=38293 RepID=UPI001EFEE871|nr:L-rhamnose mutarotase [Photobacterium damselae]
MIRKAFVMWVNSDSHAEYKKRHDEIWGRLVDVLKYHGAHNYSIYLLPDQNMLFGYVEIEDEYRWAAIAQTPECQEWWTYMKDVMLSNPDNSPQSKELKEVFHLA